MNLELKMKQIFRSSDLLITQLLDHDKVLQILVIRQYFNRKDCVFQFRSSLFKASNNDQQFLVIYFIVAFSRSQMLKEVNNRTENIFFIILKENFSRHVVR